MKKYLLLLLPLFLTLACFANDSDRSVLYTLKETVDITLPEDEGDDWDAMGQYLSSDIYMKQWNRENDEIEREEDLHIFSRYLFGFKELEVSDLLPMCLRGDKKNEWNVTLVEELADGVIVRIFENKDVEYNKKFIALDGEITETSTTKTEQIVHLVRLILSDSAYHIVAYQRDDNAEVVKWSDEDQELWADCLRNAHLVTLD